jgi:hypothetical protein
MAYGGRSAWSLKHGCVQMLLELETDGEASIYVPPSQKPNQFSLLLQHRRERGRESTS